MIGFPQSILFGIWIFDGGIRPPETQMKMASIRRVDVALLLLGSVLSGLAVALALIFQLSALWAIAFVPALAVVLIPPGLWVVFSSCYLLGFPVASAVYAYRSLKIYWRGVLGLFLIAGAVLSISAL
jgi:hypothetical protein